MNPFVSAADAGKPELSGSLDDFSLSELFELFTATHKSGVVHFGEPADATLWIVDGAVSYGVSAGSTPLRDLVERQGLLTGETFDEAAAAAQTEPLHRVLQDRFGVAEERLAAIAREQVVSTTFEIVVVGSSSFEFTSGAVDPLGGVIAMPPTDVLAEAETRRDEWRRIVELIPSTSIIPALAPTIPDGRPEVTITAEQWPVLAALDGRRSAAEVIESSGQSAFEICGILYDLLEAGTIVVVGNADDDVR